jgi:Na+/H+ antiporter NhaA
MLLRLRLHGSSQAEMDAAGLDIVDFVDVGIEVRLEAVLGSLSSYARPAFERLPMVAAMDSMPWCAVAVRLAGAELACLQSC